MVVVDGEADDAVEVGGELAIGMVVEGSSEVGVKVSSRGLLKRRASWTELAGLPVSGGVSGPEARPKSKPESRSTSWKLVNRFMDAAVSGVGAAQGWLLSRQAFS